MDLKILPADEKLWPYFSVTQPQDLRALLSLSLFRLENHGSRSELWTSQLQHDQRNHSAGIWRLLHYCLDP